VGAWRASAHGGRNAGELGSGGKREKRGGLAPPGMRMHVCGCTGARVRAKERAAHTNVKNAVVARMAARHGARMKR
jgi:hypothetical protein